eukprot:2543247-Pleurochrysis_carterae.AAC.1
MLGAEASCKRAPGVECRLPGAAVSIFRDVARAACSSVRRRSRRQASVDSCSESARSGCSAGDVNLFVELTDGAAVLAVVPSVRRAVVRNERWLEVRDSTAAPAQSLMMLARLRRRRSGSDGFG